MSTLIDKIFDILMKQQQITENTSSYDDNFYIHPYISE